LTGFLSKLVCDEGMNMTDLGDVLKPNIATIRNALPIGLGEPILPRYPWRASAYRVIARPVKRGAGPGALRLDAGRAFRVDL